MQFNLTIGGNTKRSQSGQHPVQVDWNDLPDESQRFIIQYGLKQYLADGMAGAENPIDAKAGIDRRMEKLAKADFSRTRGESDKVDSDMSRALKNAKAAIRAMLKAKNAKAEKDAVDAAAKRLVEKDEKWIKEARKELEAERKAAEALEGAETADLLADLLSTPEA